MVEVNTSLEKEILEIIPIYFDVPEHFLPLNEFIETARTTKEVIDCLNEEFFDGQFKYQLIVLPPEQGSFKSRLGIKTVTVAGILAFSWAGLESDVGKSYIKGLTGYEPAYWAEKLGESHREALTQDETEKEQAISVGCAARILSESTKGFLEQDYNELRKSGVTKKKFRSAYQAKNEFYESCYSLPAIKGIGFDDTENFPIKRNDFPNHIIDIPAKEENEEERDWIVEIRYIKVTSPNWDRSDTQRTWRGKYRQHDQDKFAVFHVEDEIFWGLVDKHKIESIGVDTLKVQWAFIEENGRRKMTRVLKVLEYNGHPVSQPLQDEELKEKLYAFRIKEEKQQDFFETQNSIWGHKWGTLRSSN